MTVIVHIWRVCARALTTISSVYAKVFATAMMPLWSLWFKTILIFSMSHSFFWAKLKMNEVLANDYMFKSMYLSSTYCYFFSSTQIVYCNWRWKVVSQECQAPKLIHAHNLLTSTLSVERTWFKRSNRKHFMQCVIW